ncbi:MAG: recombinase family protein [Firmicutes bacterium]|nr:recombinase family protein [Bacillota bacterium]
MARVSRKKKRYDKAGEEKKEKVFGCGIYARLSVENSGREESDTIENQIEIIRRYIAGRKYLKEVKLYVDNGRSGTNFDRDAFEEMMRDAEKKKIECIIVKDLSRLGRNFIQTGEYIERIFPKMSVRFIAVCDGYDSFENDEAGLEIAFKNLINDHYARDISVKITSALEIKQKNGEYIGGNPPYGYLISKEDRHRLVIDKECENIVQKIFRFRADGMSYSQIAKRLNDDGVLSPSAYRYSRGMIKSERAKNIKWCERTIGVIISNPVYVGDMVQRKSRRENYARGKRIVTKESERFTVRGTHKGIIERELFEEVNKGRL